MDKKDEKNKKCDREIVKEEYSKKITYSQSKNEPLDLLEILELHLCKSCIKL